MTDSCCDNNLLSGAEASRSARDHLGVRGFVALWRGERRTVTELTTDLATVQALRDAGRLELGDDGVLVGVHGLVARPTSHRIEHSGGNVHTWCAFDAIGIPAALGLDATAVTACAHCAAEVRVTFRDGEPGAGAGVRLWVPGGSLSHLVADFCRHANLYCNPEHLAAVVSSDQPGRSVDVGEAASIGRHTWRDVAAIGHELIEETQ